MPMTIHIMRHVYMESTILNPIGQMEAMYRIKEQIYMNLLQTFLTPTKLLSEIKGTFSNGTTLRL